MTTPDPTEINDYIAQAMQFLARSRQYLAAGDLHLASVMGWGAASHMAKAVAAYQGWQYRTHAKFHVVMDQAWTLSGDDRIPRLRAVANELHANYYRRRRHLDADAIARDLDDVAELVSLLAELVKPDDDYWDDDDPGEADGALP